MGKNSRRRRRPQLPPFASNIRPLPRPPQSERIPFDDGLQQLLSVCRPHRAARRLYAAWCDGDCAVWCDGAPLDPGLFQLALSVDVWTDDDGGERLKIQKATDMPWGRRWSSPLVEPFERSRAMGIDQTARRWEVSAAGIAALLKELSPNTEQIAPASAPLIRVQLVDSKVQLVEKPTFRAKAQSPSQPVAPESEPQPSTPQLTDAQIEEWVNDPSVPRVWREIRQFAVKEFGDWRSVSTAAIIRAARNSAEFKKRVHPFPSENTFNRALGRKKS